MITTPGWSSAGDNDFYNHDQVMTIIFMQMITSTMSMMSRLAARILAKKLLEGEGFEEGDRLKEIQEKVVDLDDDDDEEEDDESFTGWCGGWSDGREGGQCSSPRGLHSRRGVVCNLVDLNIKATHCSPGD